MYMALYVRWYLRTDETTKEMKMMILKILIMALQLTLTSYNATTPLEMLESFTFAVHEAECKLGADKSCYLYCIDGAQWLSTEEIIEDEPKCEKFRKDLDVLTEWGL